MLQEKRIDAMVTVIVTDFLALVFLYAQHKTKANDQLSHFSSKIYKCVYTFLYVDEVRTRTPRKLTTPKDPVTQKT